MKIVKIYSDFAVRDRCYSDKLGASQTGKLVVQWEHLKQVNW